MCRLQIKIMSIRLNVAMQCDGAIAFIRLDSLNNNYIILNASYNFFYNFVVSIYQTLNRPLTIVSLPLCMDTSQGTAHVFAAHLSVLLAHGIMAQMLIVQSSPTTAVTKTYIKIHSVFLLDVIHIIVPSSFSMTEYNISHRLIFGNYSSSLT